MIGFNDRLYALLPTVLRVRDLAMPGQPLRSVLSVISEQVDAVENDVAQLYANWFIETCQEWVVPYIGDLVGYEVLHEAGEPTGGNTAEALALDRILIPRQDVANTVHARRRKGTLAVLVELARDVAGWPAVAVEFATLGSITQALNDLRTARGRSVDVRAGAALERLGAPGDTASRTLSVRGAGATPVPGSLPTTGVGVYVPRYRSYSASFCAAAWVRDAGDHCFTFSPLGEDVPLFAGPGLMPVALTRDDVTAPDHYGAGKSLLIWTGGESEKSKLVPVPLDAIVAADLRHWKFDPEPGTVAVDALRGRMSFPRGQVPHRVFVAYNYGFSFEIGAGEYPRTLAAPPPPPLSATTDQNAATFEGSVIAGIDVSLTFDGAAPVAYTTKAADTLASIATALAAAAGALGVPGIAATAAGTTVTVSGVDAVAVEFPARIYSVSSGGRESHRRLAAALERWESDAPARAIIEIEDSEVYDEDDLSVELAQGQYLTVRAAGGARPIIRIVDWRAGAPDPMRISGAPDATFVLDGVLLAGCGIHLSGDLGKLIVRHATLVPGWTPPHHRGGRRGFEPSIAVEGSPAALHVERSIVGPLSVTREERAPRPLHVALIDSIVDAADRGEALSSPDARAANVALRAVRSTVLGHVRAHAIPLAENTLFDRPVTVTDRQHGCFRFCYVAAGSKTPARYECQPPEGDAFTAAFVSKRFGDPSYCRLRDDAVAQIRQGADDRAEIGAFHDLFEPQRLTNLTTRLAEYVPAGVETAIIFVS